MGVTVTQGDSGSLTDRPSTASGALELRLFQTNSLVKLDDDERPPSLLFPSCALLLFCTCEAELSLGHPPSSWASQTQNLRTQDSQFITAQVIQVLKASISSLFTRFPQITSLPPRPLKTLSRGCTSIKERKLEIQSSGEISLPHGEFGSCVIDTGSCWS